MLDKIGVLFNGIYKASEMKERVNVTWNELARWLSANVTTIHTYCLHSSCH